MIDFGKILKRAWHILWNYKVLWIFGILLAITAGRGGGSSSSYQFSSNDRNNWDNWNNGFDPNSQPAQEWSKMTAWFNEEVAPLFVHPDPEYNHLDLDRRWILPVPARPGCHLRIHTLHLRDCHPAHGG